MSEETDDIDDRFATGCTPPGSFCYGADFTVNGKPVHRIDRPQEVERLDYSKPPPDFIFPFLDKALQMTVLTAGIWGPRALAAGWSCCKAMLDPPGMYVDGIAWGLVAEVATVPGGNAATSAAARAAAWAWYDDALEVAALLDRRAVDERRPWPAPARWAWPLPLTWTSNQRAAVRRWLTEGGETPEVLRG